MSLGTLYGDVETRCILPVGLVKAFNLDIALSTRESDAFKAAFPSGKVPAFEGPKGYKLQESIAVLYYCRCISSFCGITLQVRKIKKRFSLLYEVRFVKMMKKIFNIKTVIPVLNIMSRILI